ncbi:MAG TPA: proline dehydrogenase family protein [Candidatus Baltobacteraceae bacterium]|nr:proline dehydrogenase family protein [Candidatus Baltobacteraceae bacterium]
MILDKPLRAAILAAADNGLVRRAVGRYGFRLGAQRFVAGESAPEFLAVARQVNAQGFAVACGILGESVTSREEACAAADQYCDLLRTFAEQRIDANVAFKLTHVGLDIDPALALENARRIARTALETGNTMRLDMEQSRYVDPTLRIYRELRSEYACAGAVLQSYLFRSMDDLRSLLPLAPNLRIVKGAYLEPATIAFADKRDVDKNYLTLVETALDADGYTAVATHDRRIIERVVDLVERCGIPKRGRFEFQMLYGISTPFAQELVRAGYRVRLAVPFGTYWFPYLMRRLAERPANLAFFVKGAFTR